MISSTIKLLPSQVLLFQNFQIRKRMHKKLKTDSHFVHFEVHMCFENYLGSISYSLKSLKRALVVDLT